MDPGAHCIWQLLFKQNRQNCINPVKGPYIDLQFYTDMQQARVAENGSLSARATMAIKIFVRRAFANASFFSIIAILQIYFSALCNKYHVVQVSAVATIFHV